MKNYIYPQAVSVGGHVFDIKLKDGAGTNMYNYNVADTSAQNGDIEIAVRTRDGGYICLNELNESLCHETIHQINDVWGIGLDEANVDRMAQGWMQALRSMGVQLIREE
jgi:hypothetical protein